MMILLLLLLLMIIIIMIILNNLVITPIISLVLHLGDGPRDEHGAHLLVLKCVYIYIYMYTYNVYIYIYIVWYDFNKQITLYTYTYINTTNNNTYSLSSTLMSPCCSAWEGTTTFTVGCLSWCLYVILRCSVCWYT